MTEPIGEPQYLEDAGGSGEQPRAATPATVGLPQGAEALPFGDEETSSSPPKAAGESPVTEPGDTWPLPAPPRRRVPVGVLVAIGVVLLLAVAAVVLWQTGVLYLLFPGPAAATIAPASTDMYVSVNMNMQSMRGFKHLADVYGESSMVQEAIDDSLEEQDISFEEDIQPWIGAEVGFAFTYPGAAAEGGSPAATPDMAVIASSRNSRAADAFLAKLQGSLVERGYQVEKKEFAGVTYYHAVPKSGDPVLFGTVKGFVVAASTEPTMQAVINVSQGKADALSGNERYKRMLSLLPARAAGYLVFPNMQRLLEQSLAAVDAVNPLATDITGQGETYESIGMAVVLEDDGVRVDLVVKLDPAALTPQMQNALQGGPSAGRILEWMPADAMVVVSSHNLDGNWKSSLASLNENQGLKEALVQAGESLNLTLDEELFSWAPGEYAAAFVEADTPSGIGLLGVWEVSDQQKAADILHRLAAAIEAGGLMELEDRDIGGHAMQVLVEPSSREVIAEYGFAQEHLFVGILGPILEGVVPGDFATLPDDTTFRHVQSRLPARWTANMYINIGALWELLSATAAPDDDTRAIVEPIKAAGLAASPYDAGNGAVRVTLFVYIP